MDKGLLTSTSMQITRGDKTRNKYNREENFTD